MTFYLAQISSLCYAPGYARYGSTLAESEKDASGSMRKWPYEQDVFDLEPTHQWGEQQPAQVSTSLKFFSHL